MARATLYVVGTPIGNIEDITLRALRILKEVDVILCEDTRVTRKLLEKYEIPTPTMSYHAQSSLHKTDVILSMLEEGKNLALVSDAGTPGISDPGALLVTEVRQKFLADDVAIVAIPGPSALAAAVSITGIGVSDFTFLGFMPHKKGRETIFSEILASERATIFYESPHRIMKTLASLAEKDAKSVLKVTIARELTKMFEELVSGTAQEVLEYFTKNNDKVRGEFVVIVSRG